VCFDNGDGVTKNPVEAVKWYHKAAEQGNIMAQLSLGVCFMKGQGVAKDSVEAVKWYHKAAEQGNADA
jgi:TPR repeat protein